MLWHVALRNVATCLVALTFHRTAGALDSSPPWNATSPLELRAAPMRVMFVGDSITQGHEGDWTWRYRIWEWFREQSIDVEFVGPFIGTQPPDSGPVKPPVQRVRRAKTAPPFAGDALTNGGYAVGMDPAFKTDHFASWGRAMAQDKSLIKDLVAYYQPDYLLVILGYNDLAWTVTDAVGLAADVKTFIGLAREANPKVRIAISNVPRTSIIVREDLQVQTAKYNEIIGQTAPTLGTDESPVQLVLLEQSYDCGTDPSERTACYDGLHPNILGEYQIAQAFSKALISGFGLGKEPLTIPSTLPQRPNSAPTKVRATVKSDGITWFWAGPYGALSYELQMSAVGSEWGTYKVVSSPWGTSMIAAGVEYRFRVRVDNGGDQQSEWSEVLVVKGYEPGMQTRSGIGIIFLVVVVALLLKGRAFSIPILGTSLRRAKALWT